MLFAPRSIFCLYHVLLVNRRFASTTFRLKITRVPLLNPTICQNHPQRSRDVYWMDAEIPVSTLTVLSLVNLRVHLVRGRSASSTYSLILCVIFLHFPHRHREPASHSCSPTEASHAKNEIARAIFAKNFSTDVTPSNPPVKKRRIGKHIDPAKQRQLELMKIRQRASPLDPKLQKSTLPADKRRFFRVSMDGKPTKDFWVEKVCY